MGNSEKEEQFQKAQNTVFRLLKFRLHSEKEICDKLKAKKLPVAVINKTIRHFKNLDLIDDRQFAQHWTASCLKRPFGINRIRLELKKKGINPDIIDEVIKTVTGQYDELEVVIQLAKYRASKYKNVDPQKVKQRVYAYLVRRGFKMNIIIKAIKNI